MPTLYINDQEVEARLDDRRVHLDRYDFDADKTYSKTVPVFDIDRVVFIGYPHVSMQLVHYFLRQNIPIFLLSRHGRWVSSMMPQMNGNAMRRLRQYEVAKDEHLAMTVAKALITAKIRNERRVLQRLAANRDMSKDPVFQDATNSLQSLINSLENARNLDELRGYEGIAARIYFDNIGPCFPPDMPFTTRNRRPPKDAANALLSWTYAIVTAEIEAAIRTAGLDPCLGFLHDISYGRPSLALDLLEPLRAPLCDLLVLNMVNHHYMKPEHFEKNPEDGGVYLAKNAKGRFFYDYELYMERFFKQDKDANHVTFRRVIKTMVNTVVAFLEARAEPQFFFMP